ncbi:MAG: hypothetical protein SWY16_18110 [Cyanobacteriota bacterium]|nr:hypothetical protein [Cyanobacteriota bacterium]
MTVETVTLQIPEPLYQRFLNTARATGEPLEAVMMRVLQVGSPPAWDDIPEEFQAEIAALDKLNDDRLWEVSRSRKTPADLERYNRLLERNQDGTIAEAERWELLQLRREADLFILRKAQAAALLRWRDQAVPSF